MSRRIIASAKRRSGGVARCSCELIKPGRANFPFMSTTSAPAGACKSAAATIFSIRSPRVMIAMFGRMGPPEPSINAQPE